MKKIILLLLIFSVLSGIPGKGQIDPHFTQYYASPLMLNPSLTGMVDGDYRATVNYKNQWASITTPITSKGLSFDMPLGTKGFGIGTTIMNQTAGDGGYYYNNVYVSLSYQVHLSEYKILAAGFEAGFINRGIDPTKLQFGNQFNPLVGYDPTLPANEFFKNTSAFVADGSIGVTYFDANPDASVNPFIGAALYHPTQPTDKFLAANNSSIPIRYSVHGGLRLKISDVADLTPHVVYMQQGTAYEVMGGMYVNYQLDTYKDFIAGIAYRYNDAVAPHIGLHINGFIVGVSYDINASSLKDASMYKGGLEFSVSYISRKKIKDAKFICPRL